jgi:NAD(P)-dependent dehydrogenase (short-subunit alcohol dehydrogenase family)
MSKSLFIIGAGPGIGDATARRFGSEGWHIVLGARNRTRLDQQVASLANTGVTADAIEVDASSAVSLRAAFIEAAAITGGLSAVLYNAAILRHQDLFSMTDGEVDSDLAINVGGAIATMRIAVETFADRGGIILMTGGGFALQPTPDWMSLSVGKAAVRALSQALVSDLAARNIRLGMMTVTKLFSPNSRETTEIADGFWDLVSTPDAKWETIYPAA